MKYRESGMPNEELWDTFFNPQKVLKDLGVDKDVKTLVDIGCGYGTFLIPASKLVRGKIVGIDIDIEMIKVCKKRVKMNDIKNIDLINGDISTEHTVEQLKKYKGTIDYVCLFNILHCEQPIELLKDIYDIVDVNGKVGIIHWKCKDTPRGPSREIRPSPEQIINWASKVGFVHKEYIETAPYHFGLVFMKEI